MNDRQLKELGQKSKELVEGMLRRVKRYPDVADYVAAFKPILVTNQQSYAQGRLDEFLHMKSERPIDPVYWDVHERELREAMVGNTKRVCNHPDCNNDWPCSVHADMNEGAKTTVPTTFEQMREAGMFPPWEALMFTRHEVEMAQTEAIGAEDSTQITININKVLGIKWEAWADTAKSEIPKDERKRFELWWNEHKQKISTATDLERDSSWAAWQAALSIKRAPADETDAPKETTMQPEGDHRSSTESTTEKNQEQLKQAYRVEFDMKPCQHCGLGATYAIIGPGEIALAVTYDDKDDAEYVAEILNEAFIQGRTST